MQTLSVFFYHFSYTMASHSASDDEEDENDKFLHEHCIVCRKRRDDVDL